MMAITLSPIYDWVSAKREAAIMSKRFNEHHAHLF